MMAHVSELAIDRMLAGEVAVADAAAIRDHAASCPHCGALLDDALAVQRDFVARPLGLPVPLRRRWRTPAIASAFAAAAAIALIVAWPATPSDGERARTAATQVKGTAIAGFFVAHGDVVRRGGLRETVTPGDRIELFTSTVEPAWVAVISDDAAGHRSVYVAPRRIEAGHEVVMPLSIELDDTLGAETVTAMFCPQPFDPLIALPDDCSTDHFTLTKVRR